ELNLDAFVEEELGRPIRYIQTAEHTRYQSEDNQDSEQVSLIGLELQYEPDFIAENPGVPHFPTSYFSTEGFYIERRTATDGTHYTLRTVDREPDEDLARVRTFEESPFPDDPEGTLFVGGYAAWFTPSTNTAWIKKGSPLDISSLSPDAVIERTNDWRGTGVEVLSLTPNDWTPESATLIFSHGAGSSPETYICWGDVPARNGIRVLMPYLDTGITTRTRTSRYSDIAALHGEVSQEQSTDEIVFGGHSFGAYVTLLAASANGRLGNANPQNCSDTDCPTLSAAGYIMLSGQPAQSAQADPPFWFEEDAFENLAPGLTVVYGTEDYSQVDPCMAPFSGTPTCRGDAFTASVDSPEARANQEIVVPGFQHGNFSCGINWRDRPTAATLSDLLDDIIVRVQTQTGGE
ncbi:MAG: alpha/beta hydrolase, partial [Planctomycetota bacterium]